MIGSKYTAKFGEVKPCRRNKSSQVLPHLDLGHLAPSNLSSDSQFVLLPAEIEAENDAASS
jgi:hypothetical protein